MGNHIFISYSHQDSVIAEKIANALHRVGIDIFIDKISIKPGDSLSLKIGTGLQEAKALIAILSQLSINSDWVRNELITVKNQGIPIIPFKCESFTWPAQLNVIIGDPLYIDGSKDFEYGIGILPKLFPDIINSKNFCNFGKFFPLRTDKFCPHAQIFDGTLQSCWEEKRFGRIAVVLPTDQSINLGGKVTTSFLEFLGIDRNKLLKSKQYISSREVAVLKQTNNNLVLIASTVFNSSYDPHAEDQWRAAKATLNCAVDKKCSLVLVPPIGTGSFNWPVRQAVVNWLYGAIRWNFNNVLATNKSVWIIICVPGPGDQKIIKYYLNELSLDRIKLLNNRKFSIKIRYQGKESDEIQVNHDILLGAIAKTAFRSLKNCNFKFRHGAGIVMKNSKQPFEYDANTPIGKTIFTDGDIIEVL